MIKVKAYAKLNLNLHILSDLKYKNETGYYPVHFINNELDLHDDLYFENQKEKITFSCLNNKILSNKDNFVYRAAFLLKKEIGDSQLGVKIVLKKQIPVKAGLGGGSSDAAETIKTLLKLWKANILVTKITKIITSLGSDVFYSMQGGLCEVTGKGDYINKLTYHMPKLYLILITPDISKPSTSWMYKNIDLHNVGSHIYTCELLKREIINGKKARLLTYLHNDFEDVVANQFPKLETIKQDFSDTGSEKQLIAGSGLTVVGFYLSKQESLTAMKNLQMKYKHIIWTHTK